MTIASMMCLATQRSQDGSLKFLWQCSDQTTVESIYFFFRERYYVCVSSQAGCNVGCPFCATGTQRMRRNLRADEIVAQVALAREAIREAGGPPVLDQVALAGMGEPLLNLDAVVEAMQRLPAEGLTHTVSLSTSGIVPQIYELARRVAKGSLSLFLSLHASHDAVRDHLVPINKKYPIRPVLAATRFFAEQVGGKVTATYLLLNGLNDSEDDLERVMTLLDPALYIIQLSEWNSIPEVTFERSPQIARWEQCLRQAGYEVFVQRSQGQDIDGGCGQLRSRMLPILQRPAVISQQSVGEL